MRFKQRLSAVVEPENRGLNRIGLSGKRYREFAYERFGKIALFYANFILIRHITLCIRA